MKHLLTLVLSVFVFEAAIQAQAPQLLNYQGVARNGFGNALPNRQMTLRLSVRTGSSSGAIVYSETRTVTTNSGGLYSVQIGSGGTIATTGNVASINWQVGAKFLQVEVDPEASNNFIDLGTTQLVSVPYAMSAGVATPVGSAGGDLSGTYPNPSIANSAINTIKLADAAVTTLKLADQSVTTSKLADYSVTTVKLADLSVTTGKLVDASVTTAKIADANVTTSKLADASVTDAKIVTVAGAKVTGNIAGSAANVTGTVAVANGGTGATTAAAARTNLGLGNVDNTSDLNKPISTATQAALDLKEDLSNKSTSTSLGTSDALYPTQNAVKSYVDTQVANSTIPDATNLIKGKVQLAGDLTGTAASPAVAAGAITTAKLADASVTDAKIVTVSGSKVTGNIAGNAATVTTNANLTGPVTSVGNATAIADGALSVAKTSGLQAALDAKESVSNKSTSTILGTSDDFYPTQNAVKSYVDTQVANSTIPDATNLIKGKVQLAGDLAGTAASPAVAAGAITTAKLADASVTDAKIVTVAGAKVTGNISGSADNVTGTVAVANGGTGATTAAAARTNLGLGNVDNTSDLNKPISTATQAALDLKANLASPTFTGAVTAPIYASTPQSLTDGANISWNPTLGLNASVTLGGNRTLSFTTPPTAGSYGTLVIAQDATGGRTLTLPSTANIVLGSTSTTTIALSSAGGAKDILAFYYDGTNCYWNIGQGYGSAATVASTNLASNVSGTLPVANGGTGATTLTANNVLLGNGTSALQVVAPGASGNVLTSNGTTWSSTAPAASGVPYTGATQAVDLGAYDLKVNGLTVGKGKKDVAGTAYVYNSAFGIDALKNFSAGTKNTAFGYYALSSVTSTNQNIAIGTYTMGSTSGDFQQSVAVGNQAMQYNTGSFNTVVGSSAATSPSLSGTQLVSIGAVSLTGNTSGSNNTAVGSYALATNTTGSYNTALGQGADVLSSGLDNATAIGYNAKVATNNTIQLGNTSITNVKTNGTLTAGTVTYPNAHNSIAGQVLTVNGSGTSSWTTLATIPSLNSDEFTATAAQTSFTLTQTPRGAKVWMFVNGTRIKNGAYSVSGTTVTYTAASNNSYSLVAGDRIQFDYAY